MPASCSTDKLFDGLEVGKQAERFLLTSDMCAAHRRDVLATVKQRLKDKIPTRLVSTSLIRAGVDISFPFVMRAVAGLDQLAQAAGRCNRDGESGPRGGRMLIFHPTDEKGHAPPPELTDFAKVGDNIIGVLKAIEERGDDNAYPFADIAAAFKRCWVR